MDKEKNSLKSEMDKELADMALQEIGRLNKKIKILQKALQEAGEYARKNLPASMPTNLDYANCIVDSASDPKGKRFIQYWIELATRENG